MQAGFGSDGFTAVVSERGGGERGAAVLAGRLLPRAPAETATRLGELLVGRTLRERAPASGGCGVELLPSPDMTS